jgi:(2Fe-2S) ferredoxin
VRWGSFEQDQELLELDVTALLDNPGGATDSPSPAANTVPLYAVCAHGTHDVCCAINGRPVAAVLETLRPGQVWECSHVGGDRFAANVLVLPSGLLYGRVDITDAEALVTVTEHGEVLERNARGRVGFPSEVQAAMVFVHGQRPGLRISEVRPIDSHRVSPALTSVRLAVGEEIVDIEVEAESSPTAWLTCQAGQPSSASVYRVLAMDGVSTNR